MTTPPRPFAEPLTPENCAFLLIDHQVGLLQFLPAVEPFALLNNVLGLAKTALAFDIPTVLGTSWPTGPNGPALPELLELFPAEDVIDRPFVNFWDHGPSREAVEATGRRALVVAGLATEVCVALPAIAATRDGYDVYAVVDASSDFNPLVQTATMHRLASAGVRVTTWVAVLAELAKNTREHGNVIGTLLSEHVPQYYAAWNAYTATAANAAEVVAQVDREGTSARIAAATPAANGTPRTPVTAR